MILSPPPRAGEMAEGRRGRLLERDPLPKAGGGDSLNGIGGPKAGGGGPVNKVSL